MGQETLELDAVKKQEMPASLKQIGYLYRLGIREIPEDLSRDDASRMIDEALEQQSE